MRTGTNINQPLLFQNIAIESVEQLLISVVLSTQTGVQMQMQQLVLLLYGFDTWKMDKNIINILQVFLNKCFSRTLRIFWPDRISNSDLWARTKHPKVRKSGGGRGDGWAIYFENHLMTSLVLHLNGTHMAAEGQDVQRSLGEEQYQMREKLRMS